MNYQDGPIHTRPSLRNLNPVFHNRNKEEDNNVITRAMIKLARRSGVLNASGKGLSTVPDTVYNINETDKTTPVTLESLIAKEEDAWWTQVPLVNLDLSSNLLVQLSSKLEKLCSLTVLSLHDNAIKILPPEIGKLTLLTRINLSRNKLSLLPVELFTLPDLRYLNLSHNCFTELQTSISDLHMLECLDVTSNKLSSLPSGIGFLVRLKELLVGNNHLKELPPDIVNMRSLQTLDLMQNELRKLPADMGSLRKLQYLYLQLNYVMMLPELEGCNELQELYASNNQIVVLPKNLCSKLPHLKILDLHDNKIAFLPDEIALLQSLVRLDLSNNSLTNLPTSVASLAHLINLQVVGNPIKTIRRDILQRGTTAILRLLRERALGDGEKINLKHNSKTPTTTDEPKESSLASTSTSYADMGSDGLNSPRCSQSEKSDNSVFPDRYKMRKTRCLTVTMQNLSEVPDEIFEIAKSENVNIVDLSKNRFVTLPTGLQHLASCTTELIFSNNQLKTAPTFLSQFVRITLINLSSNSLTDLPKEFGFLITLRELNICNNRFESLPSCIYDLTSLEILLAFDNRIASIDASPTGLGALKRLATLNLRNNNLQSVPPILGNLQNITSLDLIGNPFRQPRHQIIEKGTEAIMSYLRDRIPH